MEQSELKCYRAEYFSAVDQFYSCLALAQKAKRIDKRMSLMAKALEARDRSLLVVKIFLEAERHDSLSCLASD